MRNFVNLVGAAAVSLPLSALADSRLQGAERGAVADEVIAAQRAALAANTRGKGFGPQSPRDLDSSEGRNAVVFSAAPPHTAMNLCNIHFHAGAEHRGGEFTTYAGHGDGHGHRSGYRYDGALSATELAPVGGPICPGAHGEVKPGDTIEVHYVHSTARVAPGPTLGACLNPAIGNPQLRVETQVFVLVNDDAAPDFRELAAHGVVDGRHQALNLPQDTGTPIRYAGSTTGPGYNEKGSPLQVTWSVRPKVAKVNAVTVGEWCRRNVFAEDHAHGVRNLVTNPELLSVIE